MTSPRTMALLVFAHPYPQHSRANLKLIEAVQGLEGLEIRSLYDLYPDFGIDIEAEQAALSAAELVIWQHPMYWYSVPGLLKHWFDKVLARGWAYGAGGTALHGKRCLWAFTTGGDDQAFTEQGMHAHQLPAFVPPIKQTARFCGMQWLDPFVIHGAHRISEQVLQGKADDYRQRVQELLSGQGSLS